MYKQGLYILGSGTCRLSTNRAQTSFCLINGKDTFVVDLGSQALTRLEEISALDECENLHIHLSHRHTDHISGLFQLLQCLTYSDELKHLKIQNVHIHLTPEVFGIIDSIRKIWGEEDTNLVGNYPEKKRQLLFHQGVNFADWKYMVGDIEVSSVHLPAVNNHGVSFTFDERRYGLTADANIQSVELDNFSKNNDVLVFDFGHLVNQRNDNGFYIDLEPVIELAVNSEAQIMYAAHIYLRHLEHNALSTDEREKEMHRLVKEAERAANERGFKGKMLLADDLLKI